MVVGLVIAGAAFGQSFDVVSIRKDTTSVGGVDVLVVDRLERSSEN
jgi:hypothetical protein